MPSMCIIPYIQLKLFAAQFGNKYIDSNGKLKASIGRIFINEYVSHYWLQQIFSFDSITNVQKNSVNFSSAISSPILQNVIQEIQPIAEIKKRGRGKNSKDTEPVAPIAEIDKVLLVQNQDKQVQKDLSLDLEAFYIENWKVRLYETQQVKYPNEPLIKQMIRMQSKVFQNTDQEFELEIPLSKIFTSQMLFFKKQMMQKFDNINKIINDFVVTLTVPCQAKPAHLAFIRWCAKEACLSNNVVFIHEPTSAFAQIVQYDDQAYGSKQEIRQAPKLSGGIYIVVDAGAGTTDISIIEYSNTPKQMNVLNTYGINLAGKDVDDAIKREILFEQKLGLNQKIKDIQGKSQLLYSEQQKQSIYSCFNRYKRSSPIYQDLFIEIQTTEQQRQYLATIFVKDQEDKNTAYFKNEETFIWSIKHEVIEKVITEQIQKICNYLKLSLEENSTFQQHKSKTVNFISVGGLGGCALFINELESMIKQLNSRYQLVKYQNEKSLGVWIKMLQCAVCAGGAYLDDEKDHVKFDVIKSNFVLNNEQRKLIALLYQNNIKLSGFKMSQNSMQYLKIEKYESQQTNDLSLINEQYMYVTAQWDGIRFNINNNANNTFIHQIYVSWDQLGLTKGDGQEQITKQLKYVVVVSPILFGSKYQTYLNKNNKVDGLEAKIHFLQQGYYTVSIKIMKNLRNKWLIACELEHAIKWK